MTLFTNFSPTEIAFDDGLGQIRLKGIAKDKWQLLEPFSYTTLAGAIIRIPRFFETDGASSPLHLAITEFGGRYNTAAVVHDYLYNCLRRSAPDPAAPTREDADDILFEIMKRCGVNPAVRLWIWLAVRAFGAAALRKLLAVRP